MRMSAKFKILLSIIIVSFLLIISFVIYKYYGINKFSKDDKVKIAILGIDGAGWNMMQPLIKKNKLPHIQSMMARGAYGYLETFKPVKSIVVWTSIATGKKMAKHGIVDWTMFSRPLKQKYLTTGHQRKTKAFWNIISDMDRSVGVVNWWATWPPDKVKGFIVSERFSRLTKNPDLIEESDFTYPPQLILELKSLLRSKKHIKREMRQQNMLVYSKRNREKAFMPTQNFMSLFATHSYAYLQDKIAKDAAIYLLSKEQPDFFGIVIRLIDTTSHFSWHLIDRSYLKQLYDKSVIRKEELTPEEITVLDEKFSQVLEPYYIYIDNLIGDFLKVLDEQTIVFIVSDHGFCFEPFSYRHYWASSPPAGIIIVAGPNISSGITLHGATIYDILPTALYLSDLPVGKDMDGKVIIQAINKRFLKRHPVEYIPTYDTARSLQPLRKSPIDSEIMKELKSLGYIK
jgi:predicted AlkP superfamily phosphohydrolase/phosphomutase